MKFRFIPASVTRPLCLAVIMQIIAYLGTRIISTGLFHFNLETAWDLSFPFLPWMIVVYLGSFPFWFANILICAWVNPEKLNRLICACLLAQLVCIVFFLVLPTTNTRPELGSGFWNSCMALLYQTDPADNLFPSMHCMLSWLCYLAVKGEKKVPKWYQIFSFLFCLTIFFSTMATKQHILLDVLGGWFLAIVCSRLSKLPRVYRVYNRIINYAK